MMTKGSMAPGQENTPNNEHKGYNKNAETSEEISQGANTEDQLEKLEQNAPEGDEGKQIGAEPKAYQYHRELKDPDEKDEEAV